MATMLNPNAIPDGSITQQKIDPSVLAGKQDTLTDTDGGYGQRVAKLEKEGIASQEKLSELDSKTSGIDISYTEDYNTEEIVIGDSEEDPTAIIGNKGIKLFGNVEINGNRPLTEGDTDGYLKQEDIPQITGHAQVGSKKEEVVVTDEEGNEIFKLDNENMWLFGKSINPNSNVLNGKKWAVVGDSFSNGDFTNSTTNNYIIQEGKYKGKYKVYGYLIGNRNNMDIQHLAFGGRTLATPEIIKSHNCFTDVDSAGNYKTIDADVDYITIYLGINDSHNEPKSTGNDGEVLVGEIPIGEITDTTINTFCGAWNVALKYLIENYPKAHIGVIVSNGCDKDDYRVKTIAICKKFGIPYIDLNGDERTPMMLRSTNPGIADDIKLIRYKAQAVNYYSSPRNGHPNEDAHLYESYIIENFLRTL